MIAAVYARKSTEQERGDTGDSLSLVEEQLAGAKAFIAERGGEARKRALTASQRTRIARQGARARWATRQKETAR